MQRHGHRAWSLVFFTTLTQMAVGTTSIWGLSYVLLLPTTSFTDGVYNQTVLWVTMVVLVIGVISGVLHLGSPLNAFAVLSNMRRSWLSREAFFGGLFGLLVLSLLGAQVLGLNTGYFLRLLLISALASGLMLVYGVSRLYRLRTVPAWNTPGTQAAFFTTSLLLGVVVNAAIWIYLALRNGAPLNGGWSDRLIVASSFIIFVLVCIQLSINALTLIYLNAQGGAAAESSQMVWSELRGTLFLRWSTAMGGIGVLVLSLVYWLPPPYFFIAFGLVLISEILGRYLFYGFYRRTGI